jgi:hypothetical protein
VNITANPARDQQPDWQHLPGEGGVGSITRTEP